MKSLIKINLKGLLGVLLIFLFSCNSEDCERLNCGANSQCNDGICECAFGYEKSLEGGCGYVIRDKYIGEFTAIDYCNDNFGTQSSYSISIVKSNDDIAKFEIHNLFKSGTIIIAEVSASNEFTIPSQVFRNETIYGNGSIINVNSDKRITISFNVESNNRSTSSCSADLISN